MNIGVIVKMIEEDPTILDDIKGFLKKVNTQDRPIETITRDVIIVSQKLVSFAELNGGLATQEDIDVAQKTISQKQVEDQSKQIFDLVQQKISDGTAIDLATCCAVIIDVATKAASGDSDVAIDIKGL